MVSPDRIARLTVLRPRRITTWLYYSLCLLAVACTQIDAQVPQGSNTPPADQILASYEGQTVTSIDIAGRPDLQVSQFASDLAQQSGQPFDKVRVDKTAAALKTAGNFQKVRVQAE